MAAIGKQWMLGEQHERACEVQGHLRSWGSQVAWLWIFSAWEIERRPRGASRRKAAPTFVDCPQEVGQKIQPLGGPMGKYTEQFK
ncbi:MAG: hypothetical protein ACN6P0_24875, partial [Pseudomonas capeferrum]|uniref:hypothetical protein n=1 Tax=Pseudomonas capeferrum TaxID=1495066 RepID=UPI003D1349CB